MKINAVQNLQQNYYQKGTNSFKGLWGNSYKRNEKIYSDTDLEIYDYEKKEYFPFSDESLQSVSNLLKENTTYQKIYVDKLAKEDCMCTIYKGVDISVKQPLLFSANQWKEYITNKLPTDSIDFRFIEQNLRKIHLERYLKKA